MAEKYREGAQGDTEVEGDYGKDKRKGRPGEGDL